MEIRHYCVSLLDVPEVLPFGFEKNENVLDMFDKIDFAEGKLLEFMSDLEKEFKENIYRLGQDMIGGKLYKRYMFKKDGFLEIAMEKPSAIIAHFITKERGRRFAESLARVIPKYVKGEIADLMINDISVTFQEKEELNHYKLAELRKLRDV